MKATNTAGRKSSAVFHSFEDFEKSFFPRLHAERQREIPQRNAEAVAEALVLRALTDLLPEQQPVKRPQR